MLEALQNINVDYLLSSYGYLAILVLTFLEGESIVVIAGIAASQGLLNPVYIALCAFLGSFTSDQVMFSLGKYKGSAMLRRFPRLHKNMEKATRLIKKYDTIFILGFRFVYGVRNVVPIMLGLSEISHSKFFSLNFIGAVVWAITFTAGGYYAGHAFTHMMENLGSAIFYAIGGVLLLIGIFAYFRWRKMSPHLTKMAEKGRIQNENKKTEENKENSDK